VPVIGTVLAGIVIATGLATVGFLVADGRPIPAFIAMILSAAFALLIAMLVPQTNVTLQHGSTAALSITQQSNVGFPVVTYAISTPDRKIIARVRRSVFSRLLRNRWTLLQPQEDVEIGSAVEESLSKAWLRKFAGKFSARYQSNIRIRYDDADAAWIIRRPNADRERDLLEITGRIDHRVAVGLATLIFGSEP
jgi:hypothetical protein